MVFLAFGRVSDRLKAEILGVGRPLVFMKAGSRDRLFLVSLVILSILVNAPCCGKMLVSRSKTIEALW